MDFRNKAILIENDSQYRKLRALIRKEGSGISWSPSGSERVFPSYFTIVESGSERYCVAKSPSAVKTDCMFIVSLKQFAKEMKA